jgi:hypothetical protein
MVSSANPQYVHNFHSFWIGALYLGYLNGPIGFTFPQNGHALESGGAAQE